MRWFFERLREPSTAAGVGLAYTGFQAWSTTGDWRNAVGALLAGLVAISAPEAGDGGRGRRP